MKKMLKTKLLATKTIFVDRRDLGLVGGRASRLDTTSLTAAGRARRRAALRALLRRYSAQRCVELHARRQRSRRPLGYLLPDQTCAGWLLWTPACPTVWSACRPHEKQCGRVDQQEDAREPARELGLKPADIRYLALSHSHPDHVGNLNLFPTGHPGGAKGRVRLGATVWWPAFQAGAAGHQGGRRSRSVRRRQRDADFHARTLARSPMPARQVRPRPARCCFSGDAVHTRANWDSHRVPERNFNMAQSLASLRPHGGRS